MANDFAAILPTINAGDSGTSYDNFIRLANRLIVKRGRDIELLKDTASSLIDPVQPRLGRRPRTSTSVLKGVFDQPSFFQDFTQSTTEDALIKQAEATALIAPIGLSAAPGIKDKIRTLGSSYQITAQVTIAPGNEPVLFVCLLALV